MNTWIVTTTREDMYGDLEIDSISAAVLNVDAGCLIFGDDRGVTVKALGPGTWRDVILQGFRP